MTEQFQGFEPITKPCYDCKHYDATRSMPHCMKAQTNTSQARAYKTKDNDCWEIKK